MSVVKILSRLEIEFGLTFPIQEAFGMIGGKPMLPKRTIQK
jgi:hypothetical protein